MSKIIGYLVFFSILMNPLISVSQSCNDAIPATTSPLQDNGNGTVSDAKTALVWKKCSEGQHWDTGVNRCEGSANAYPWQGALQRVEAVNQGGEGENLGKSDWRLPNIKELNSILERKCWGPAINLSVFPSTPTSWFWSSSFLAYSRYHAWAINFNYGMSNWYDKSYGYPIRLVRSGQ